jgi:hypothetical protein
MVEEAEERHDGVTRLHLLHHSAPRLPLAAQQTEKDHTTVGTLTLQQENRRGMNGKRPIEILSITDGKSPQVKHNTTHEQVKGTGIIRMESRRQSCGKNYESLRML